MWRGETKDYERNKRHKKLRRKIRGHGEKQKVQKVLMGDITFHEGRNVKGKIKG